LINRRIVICNKCEGEGTYKVVEPHQTCDQCLGSGRIVEIEEINYRAEPFVPEVGSE
jgi:DnaJ-class molecular chaperone